MKARIVELGWAAAAIAVGMVLYQVFGSRLSSLFGGGSGSN
jgi:hypothetical protein